MSARCLVIIEGESTAQIKEMGAADHPMHSLYESVRSSGMIAAVCKACAAQNGALEAAESQGLIISAKMSGHVSLGRYLEEGFRIVVL